MKSIFNVGLLAMISMACLACEPINRFEASEPVDSKGWNRIDTFEYNFMPADTAVYFKESILVRHTNDYPYRNMWLGKLVFENDTLIQRDSIQIQLSSNQEQDWLGNCINDICEIDATISLNNKLNHSNYTVKLIQINRDNPLNQILSIGYRIQPQ